MEGEIATEINNFMSQKHHIQKAQKVLLLKMTSSSHLHVRKKELAAT